MQDLEDEEILIITIALALFVRMAVLLVGGR